MKTRDEASRDPGRLADDVGPQAALGHFLQQGD
ncbi:MAG: hypothetical protein RL339_1008, partial [Pseudomonadota bacterium]